ncbi:MAG: caspase family protein [Mariprofundaceae bacterium]
MKSAFAVFISLVLLSAVFPTAVQPAEAGELKFKSALTHPGKKSDVTRVFAGSEKWKDSGQEIKKGVSYRITAEGKWRTSPTCKNTGPNGGEVASLICLSIGPKIIPSLSYGTLIARIGETGTPFGVGGEYEFTAQRDGILYFRINDKIGLDNSGAMQVKVSRIDAPAIASGPPSYIPPAETIPVPARALHAQDIQVDLQTARDFIRGGYPEKAENTLNRILKLNRKNPEVRFLLGSVAEQKGDYSKAMNSYIYAAKLNTKYLEAYYGWARVALASGKEEKAIRPFGAIVRIEPGNIKVHYQLGRLFLKYYSKHNKARVHLQKVLELDPNHRPALEALIAYYTKLGLQYKVKEYEQRLAKLRPIQAKAHPVQVETQPIRQTERRLHRSETAWSPSHQKTMLQRWAVVIGISDYRDSRIPSLRYAATDAKAFYTWLVSPGGGKYAPARVNLLLNERATGKNIKQALYVWLAQAIEEDLVTIYYAGHGSAESPDHPDNLFLLPHDVQYGNIASTGFPMWDIETALKRFIRAKKVIVISDACHSGGIGQAFDIARRANKDVKNNPINRGLQDLSKVGDGIAVISASAENQFSVEGQQYGGGHGVFTYYLMRGLENEADYNKDNTVTLGELIPYLSENVRRATRSNQSPTVAGRFDPALSIEK